MNRGNLWDILALLFDFVCISCLVSSIRNEKNEKNPSEGAICTVCHKSLSDAQIFFLSIL